MELKTKRLKITELTFADLQNIHLLHSLPEIDQYNTLGIPESIQITENILNDWLDLQKKIPRISHILCIRKRDNNEFIGLIGLTLGKMNYRIAEVWYKILPAFWGQGLTTEALAELLKFGFLDLGLHRIEAGCAIENVASFKVLGKVGMIREGQKRRVLPLKGQWSDNYIYGILDTDFISIHV
jgi:RimJ/RimL family protein N-acetyltransferase